MKKILSMILCICLLLGATATAEEGPGEDSFLLRIWNESGLEISYLHFDFYTGDFLACTTASCPNEGEEFYRAEFSVTPETAKDLRIWCAYGISDLAPEDAILEFMTGKPREEHPVEMPEITPENGKIYDLELVSDGEGILRLQPVETVG